MKLARFTSTGDGTPRLGIVTGSGMMDVVLTGIVDIAAHLPDAPRDMIGLITAWDRWSAALAGIARRPADVALDAVTLLAPIARPGKTLCIGLNYADHAAEAGLDIPTEQFWFSKPGTAIAAPHAPIALPRVSDKLDYEAELVFVIGRSARHVSLEDAPAHIFGYCAGNDVSVRDWQFKTSQVMLGKSFDGHAPFGPWIVTADEIDPADLGVRCLVNGEQRQSSSTRHLIFDCPAQIAYLSQVMTLEPGDILFTGTPSGVAAVMSPPRWLQPGDVVRVEIDGIGAIENVVEHES